MTSIRTPTKKPPLPAPFPWFGGKSRAVDLVWPRFGNVTNYVEPFFGSGAMLLGRPQPLSGPETINDKDGFVANFWRAVKADPEKVAFYADQPVNENDLHARHAWLAPRRAELVARLEGDPDYCDAKIAGWWAWGACVWIGSGWCSGKGPWKIVDDKLVREPNTKTAGCNRQLPHLSRVGQGVNRQLPHLGNESSRLIPWFNALAERLRFVRVCCGDWARVLGPSPTTVHGVTGVFLDPPYSAEADRTSGLYSVDDLSIAHKVREWAIANGDNPKLRIALCGYDGEHAMSKWWSVDTWHAPQGYAGRSIKDKNSKRERIWFSPHCISKEDACSLRLL